MVVAPAPFPTPRCNDVNTYTARGEDSSNTLPIVIDNGSHHVRAGFADREDPDIIFRSVVSRFKTKSQGDALWVGGCQTENTRYYARTAFEQDVVVNFDIQETIFDYIFSVLAGTGCSSIDHPVVLTETLCNPPMCRGRMSELLFEGYGVPGVTYGVDSLFSYLHNTTPSGTTATTPFKLVDGMVLSSGHETTSLVPVVDGRFALEQATRLNLGGHNVTDYLGSVLSTQYAMHRSSFTSQALEVMKEDYCRVSNDYSDDVYTYARSDTEDPGPDGQDTANTKGDGHLVVLQLPFTPTPKAPELTEEQKAAKLEKQREAGRRLQEMAQRKRAETLARNEETLAALERVAKLKSGAKSKFDNELKARGLTEQTLNTTIRKLQASINKAKGIPVEEEEKKMPVYDLIDRPDAELTPEQLKEKKKQVFLKNASEGRKKQQELRLAAKAAKEAEIKALHERFAREPETVIQEFQQDRAVIRKRQEDRRKRRADLTNRRSDAARQRMRAITQAAFANPDDNFGQSDSDWQLYLDMQKGGDASDSEEDADALQQLDAQLMELAPHLYDEDGAMLQDTFGGGNGSTGGYAGGVAGAGGLRSSSPFTPVPEEVRHQVRLSVNRIRAPEILFQPTALCGHQQAGLAEMLEGLFKRLSSTHAQRVSSNIVLTGGNTKLPGFEERIRSEVMAMRPFQSSFTVRTAGDPCLDPWRGAAAFARAHGGQSNGGSKRSRNSDLPTIYMSKAEWAENGDEYFKEHVLSNVYYNLKQ